MDYNRLGNTGMKVSRMALGSWLTFGERYGIDVAKKMIKVAFDHGINLFDNAEVYANGVSEMIMGDILRDYPRKDYVLITKIFFGGEGINDMGHSRKRLVEGTERSLRRLGHDYVDILYCHRYDDDTPMEETVRTMDLLIRQGKALYWGTSMWEASQIEHAHQVAKELGCIAPVVEQSEYSMFVRDRIEKEFAPLFDKYKMGVTSYSPLAWGLLTGKYQKGVPADSRFQVNEEFRHEDWEKKLDTVEKLGQIAKELGCSLAQLAIAWVVKNPNVTSVLIGASRQEQLEENLAAYEIKEKLSDDVMNKIQELLQGH